MTASGVGRVGILWRQAAPPEAKAVPENPRLRPLFEALSARNVDVQALVFHDDTPNDLPAGLAALDGVLVWVDPITDGHDRSRLDPMLCDVARDGTWVSAHPDIILKMGTKEVLFETRELSWGGDTRVYRTMAEFIEKFPAHLGRAGRRVIKRHRGNGGIGVWKVELPAPAEGRALTGDDLVRIQDARPRDQNTELLALREFMARCETYFSPDGCIIDQAFQPRIVDGMIRCYIVYDEVAGFAHQSSADVGGRIFGLPSKKTMYDASEPRFRSLKAIMESEWIPGMQRLLHISRDELPLLWDADFLYGPPTDSGSDTYVLCEINVSCVLPFPDSVVAKFADAIVRRLQPPKSA